MNVLKVDRIFVKPWQNPRLAVWLVCLKSLAYLQINSLGFHEKNNVIPGHLFPVPLFQISMLEKLQTWKVKSYQQHCNKGGGETC